MANGFERFKELVTSGAKEPARSNLYEVRVSLPPAIMYNDPVIRRNVRDVADAINYFADNVVIPGRRITTSEVKDVGMQRKYATGVAPGELTISFVLTKDLLHRTIFERWMNYTATDAENRTTFYDEYTSQIIISKWELGSNVIYDGLSKNGMRYQQRLNRSTGAWQFFSAYPVDMQEITLDNDEADLIKMNISFAFERYRFDTIADDVLGFGPNTSDRFINEFGDVSEQLGFVSSQKDVARFGV
tara:strand:+ start:193 stop:927 length:735 start_codon:yes stop_codon:yes gene_type:complete